MLSTGNDADVFFVGDESSAHRTEMRCLKLAIYEFATQDLEHVGQMDECQFRGIRYE